MKISHNWLRQFLDTDKSPQQLSEILTAIGLEVESLEKVQPVTGGLEGLVVGLVKQRWQHPNADRLSLTRVDVGGPSELQIVCGAPNVAEGQKVVVALVGTTVYPVSGDPLNIFRSKIRGEVSEGMICAEDEIGMGTSHAGILVLSPDAPVGQPAKEYFQLQDDYVYEIGLTPNRADAASHMGTARDIAAFLRTAVRRPDVSSFRPDNAERVIPVQVENEVACPRYSSLTISGVTVGPSPTWLKERMEVIGLRSINNIVDITNYVLHGLGQPLHAFDADEISGSQVLVKTCDEGTRFTTLDGTERILSAEDLMICDGREPMCIAGVFGGARSGVKEATRNIFLESACFNPVWVRKTAKRHSLKTDASFRFERGTDPDITVLALRYAALLIKELAGGSISSDVSDHYPRPVEPFRVGLSYEHLNRLIGQQISPREVRSILESLEIHIESESDAGLAVRVPPYRVDVRRDVDVVEEILRIYGYNNIGIPRQLRASLNHMAQKGKEEIQEALSAMLSANGFNEILSNSLTSSANLLEPAEAVQILNPLSSDLDVLRQTLLYSGLEAIAYNQNRRHADLKFYEFGKVYTTQDGKYREGQRLAVFMTGREQAEQWSRKPAAVNFYGIKGVVDGLLDRLNLNRSNADEAVSSLLGFGLRYLFQGRPLVEFGSVSAPALAKADIGQEVFYAEFDFDLILRAARQNRIVYQEVSKFPAVRRDLSMLVDKEVSFGQLNLIARKTERKLLKDVSVFDVYEGERLPAGKKSYALSFTLQDDEKTLTDRSIDAIMQKLIYNFGKEAGAEIRK